MADRSLSNITLQDAYSRAQAALEGGDSPRAVAITQHILRYYPQYIDAYRLLGEAYLELGRPEEAMRFFTHVLNADPQNVLAHIGRAIIAEDHHQVDIAIDEYERAFEIDPSITELRGELLRLYAIRYGSAGAAIRTTPSGLAYVHLRAGLRDAAISELGYVAQVRPDRWDVEVALAEALWRNEQLDECAAVAGDILAGHPACVKCKWLLGYLHWSSGRTESGRQYLMDAVALDPAYRIANAVWDATPWPVDRRITRAQTAMVPGWTQEELAGSDLDISVALPPEPPASKEAPTAPGGSRRVTQKFDTRPPLPGESRRVTQKFDTRPPLPGQTSELTPAEEVPAPPAAAAEALEWDSILSSPDAPAPFDLDWLDDWAAAAETTPAAPAQSAHATLEFEAIAPPAAEDSAPPPDTLVVRPAPEAAPPEAAAEATAPEAVLTEGAAEVAKPEVAAVEAAAEVTAPEAPLPLSEAAAATAPEAPLAEVAAAAEPEAALVETDGITEQEATEIAVFPVSPAEAAPAGPPADEAGLPAAEPDGFLAWLSEPATGAPQAEEIEAGPAEDIAEAWAAAESPAAQAGMFPAWLDEQPADSGAAPPAEGEDAAVPITESSSAQPSMFPEWMGAPANAVQEAVPAESAAGEATANAVEAAAPAESAADVAATEPADQAEAGAPAPARHQVVHLFPAWLEEATSDDEDESDLEMLPAWMREAGPLEAGTPAAAAETTADAQVASADAAIPTEHAEEAVPAAPVPADALSLITAEQEAPAILTGEEPVARVAEDQEVPPAISPEEPTPFAAAAQEDGADMMVPAPTEAASADESPLIGEPALPIMEPALAEAEAGAPAQAETVVAGSGAESEPAAVAATDPDAAILPDDLFPAWLEEIERSAATGATEAQAAGATAPETTAEEAAPAMATPPEASTEEAAPVMAATVPEALPAEEPQAVVPEAMSAGDVQASAAPPEALPAEDAQANEAAPEALPAADIQASTVAPEDVPAEVVPANDVAPEDVPAQGVPANDVAPEALPAADADFIVEPATPPSATAATSEPGPAAMAGADRVTESAAQLSPSEDETFPAWMSETGAASLPVVVAPDVPEAESAESADREPAPAAPPAPVASAEATGIAASAPGDMPQPEIDASAAAETASAQEAAPETPATEASVLPDWLTEAVNVQTPEATGAPTPLALDEETLFAADHTLGGQAGEIPIADDLFPAWLEAGPSGALDGGELPPPLAAQVPSETPVRADNSLPPMVAAEDAAFPAGQDAAASAQPAGFAEAAGTPDTTSTAQAAAPGLAAGSAEHIPAPPDTSKEADAFPAWMAGSWFEVAVAPAPGEPSAEPLVIVPESAIESSTEPAPPVEAGANLPATEAAQAATPEAAGEASVAEAAAAENELIGAPGFVVAGDSAPVVSYSAEATPEAADPLHEEILDWPAAAEGSPDAAEADHPTEPDPTPEETAAPPVLAAAAEPHDMHPSESAPDAAAAADTESAGLVSPHAAEAEGPALSVLAGPEPGVGAPSTPGSAPADAAAAPPVDAAAGEAIAETAAPAPDASAGTAESRPAPALLPALDHFAKVGYNHADDSQVPDDTAAPGPPLTPAGTTGADAGPGERPAAVEAGHLPDGAVEHGAPAAGQAAFATSEEDNMAPSYKEDDDQERQFDFDWDRDALPDYLKPFLMNETPGQPGQPPAPAAPAGPTAGAAPPAGRPMPPAPGAGGPGSNDFNLDLDNIQPFDFGAPPPAPSPGPATPIRPLSATPPPVAPPPQQSPGGFNESDFGGVQPFNFGAPAGPGGGDEFDFGSEALPSWLGSGGNAGPAFSFDTSAGPQATEPAPGPDLSSPGIPDWLRTPETETPQAARPGPAAPPPPAAPGGDFDFGSEALPSWLSASAAPAPPAANDFGDVQPFDFGAPAGQGQPQPFDFGAPAGGQGQPQPFDFGAMAGGGPQPFNFGAPATPERGPAPAPAQEFDLGGVQPFDFGAPATPAPPAAQSTPGGPAPGGDFDFGGIQPFDFGGTAAQAGESAAPQAAGAPGEFDFSMVESFDFRGPGATPSAGGANDFDFGGVQPFDFGGAPAGGEMAGDVSDVDDFIDFLSVGAGNAAPAVPAPDEFAFDLGGDVQPFSLEGMGLGSTPGAPSPAFGAPPAPGPAFSAPPAPMAGAPAGGVRLPAGPGPEEMGSLAGDEFSFEPFMFDAAGGAAPPAPSAPPAFNQAPAMPTSPFNPGSAFANRAPADVPPGLEDLPDLQPFSFEGLDATGDQGYGFDSGAGGQSFGRRATDRGETSRSGMAFNLEEETNAPAGDVHSFSWQRRSTPAREPAHAPEAPETAGSIFAKARKRKEELEQTLRQEAEARGEVYTPPPVAANLHPEEAAELSYWPNLDEEEAVASAPAQPAVQPFDFTAVAGPTPADVAQDMASLQLAPFEFEEEGPPAAGSPTIQLPEESAQASAQAPAAPQFAADQTIQVPLQDQAGLEAGAPAMPEPFAFEAAEIPAEIQPFSFDLGAEAQAAPAEAQAAPPPAEPFAFEAPEPGAAPVEPFAFEVPAGGPTAVQPFTFEAQEGPPPAVEPFTFEVQESAAATAEPFAFEPEAGEAAPVQPFSFEAQESEAAAIEPFSFETQETEAAAVQPFTFEAPEAGAPVEPFVFDTAAPAESAAQAAPVTAEAPEAAAPAVEPFAFDMTEAPEAPAVEPFTFDMAESVAPPTFEPAEPSAAAPQAEAAPQEAAAGELLWSIPVAEAGNAPTAEATATGGFGEEVAPGEFDFSGLQPFDLGALDLTPEERAYLTGEAAAAEATPAEVSAQAPAEPTAVAAPEEPAGIPELQLQQTEPAGPIEPFSFDMTEFEPPAAEPPAMDLGGVPPAEAPGYEAGAPTATVEPVEFGMSEASEAATVEPFEFDTEAAAPAPAEPFQFEPFQFEPEAPPAPEPVEIEAEATEDEAALPFSFEASAEPAVTHYETTTRTGTGPLAAETWAEIPAAGAFDFSGVEMDQAPTEPAVAEAPEPAVAQAPEPVVAQAPEAPAAEAPVETPAPVPPAPVAEAPAPKEASKEAPVAAQPAPVPVAPPAPAGGSIDDLARHLRENPDDTAGRLALAIGYEQRDDISRAAEQYRLLIKGRNVPENLLDIVTGNLRDLVEAQPDNPSLHRLLGDAYMKQGQYQMAIAQYNWLLTKGTR